ncbi:MAG: class I SAM-dependent methyltransferase [Dehalococcoidia bacterium]|nr:class I SAM-dependent methyltransferase [Dehalococcoidia bacterium]
MNRRQIEWNWSDPEAQRAFAEWVGFPDSAATERETDRVLALTGVKAPSRVLDVGCGTGRHGIVLARRGFAVVGIDIADTFLEEARRAAEQAGVDIEFRLQSGRDLAERERFHLALAFNHTLGFLDDEEVVAHFSGVLRSLVPGGRFFLRLAGPVHTPNWPPAEERSWGESGSRYILSRKTCEGSERVERNIEINTATGDIIEFVERQRARSMSEVVDLLQRSGFVQPECFNDLDGSPADEYRFGVFICERP